MGSQQTNTPKGKQVYIACDLLIARVNFPPGPRCEGLALDAYPKDVHDWCGIPDNKPVTPFGPI
jgi:hypothetical protein